MRRALVVLAAVAASACATSWRDATSFGDDELKVGDVGVSHHLELVGDVIIIHLEQLEGLAITNVEVACRADGVYLRAVREGVVATGPPRLEVVLPRGCPSHADLWWVTSVDPPRRARATVRREPLHTE